MSGARHTYNAADELTENDDGTTQTALTYDKNGNQLSEGADSFEYDLENRMVESDVASNVETYTWDGDGNRTSVTANSTTEEHLWDINGDLPILATERSSGGSTIRSYTYGLVRISQINSGGTDYYHHGIVGSVLGVTDASGGEQWAYEYTPFGAERSATKVDAGAADNPMQFAGEMRDSTDLYHLRARQYDPGLGRFTATDPVEWGREAPMVNRYHYAANRPGIYTDPSGEVIVTCTCFGAQAEAAVDQVQQVEAAWEDGGWLGVANLYNPLLPLMVHADQCLWGSWGGEPLSISDAQHQSGDGNHCWKATAIGGALLIGPKVLKVPGNAGYVTRGSTGRASPRDLREQLAMEEVVSNPSVGRAANFAMTDSRWPATEGWVKMHAEVNGVKVHFVRNKRTGWVDDFKFDDRGMGLE